MQSLALDQQIVAELGSTEPESIANNILNYYIPALPSLTCGPLLKHKVSNLYLIKMRERFVRLFLCPLSLPSLPK